MLKSHEIPRDEWISDGTYLERVRKQLLSDYRYTKKDIARAKESVEYYKRTLKEDKHLKEASQVMVDKYSEWVKDLEEDLKNLEFLIATTNLKMHLGGFKDGCPSNGG